MHYTCAGLFKTNLFTAWQKNSCEKVVPEVMQAGVFSVLADETKDIGSIEQLSILFRYVQVQLDGSRLVEEEFLGFTKAVDMSGEALSKEILNNLT